MKIPTIKHTYTDENGRTVAVLDGIWESEKEIEEASRAHMEWLNSQIKPDDWTASKEKVFHESPTFMDYLHGDVKDEEAESACRYEYARESWQMWKAFKVRKEARENGKLNCENDFWQNVFYEAEVEDWIRATPWATELLMCESFPKKDWNKLEEPERKKIMLAFYARRKVEPLPLHILHYSHYPKEEFPEFNELSTQTKPVMKNVLPGEPHEPVKIIRAMVQKSGAVYFCLFDVDFSESKNLLHDRFVAWLNQDAIEKLWRGYKKQITKKTKKPLRAKKDLRWEGTRAAYWCLFEVDLSANKGDITAQFDKWLASRKIRERLKRYKQEKRGTSDKWKDRLKDLAAWRLYRENENSCDKANKFANDNRKKFKTRQEIHAAGKTVNGKLLYKFNDPRPFRDAKAIKGELPIAANEADLFSVDDDYRHAKGEVLKRLSDLMPSDEFKEPSPSMKALLATFK